MKAIATVLALVSTVAPAAQSQRFTAQVVAVHDGDTITVRTASETLRVRLADVDCPELGQPWSSRARQFTSQLVFGKTVAIEPRGADQYERTIARVSVGSVDVAEELLRAGMAWRYQLGAADARLLEAEQAARRARAGLWAEPAPVPPWEWRRAHQVDPRAPGGSAAPRGRERTARVNIRDARGPFHGNVHSHVYHRAGCPNYNCKSCDETFLTPQSAEEAGYTPAGDCLRAP